MQGVLTPPANAIDQAIAFRSRLDSHGETQQHLANEVGLDRSTVANTIRLLGLPVQIQEAVRSNVITQGHARAILGLAGQAERLNAFRRIVAEGLSVRQAESLVATGDPDARNPKPRLKLAARLDFPTLAEVESEYIDRVLRQAGGNKPVAAATLGISLKTLYNKLNAAAALAEGKDSQ